MLDCDCVCIDTCAVLCMPHLGCGGRVLVVREVRRELGPYCHVSSQVTVDRLIFSFLRKEEEGLLLGALSCPRGNAHPLTSATLEKVGGGGL